MKQKNLITTYILTTVILLTVAISNQAKLQHKKDALEILKRNYKSQELAGLDLKLIEAIIHVESSGNPNAVSSAGAKGLMQIVYKWHDKRCGLTSEEQLFNPADNINCGVTILNHYLKLSGGNIRKALEKYHGGYSIGNKSKQYARKVLAVYEELV